MTRFSFIFLMAAAAMPLFAEKELTPDELAKMLEDKSKIFLLDVREKYELDDAGVIDGYYHIPLGDLEKRLKEVPKDKLIITVCMRGHRAGEAAAILEENGYNVYGSCGIEQYKAKGYKVSKPAKK